MPLAEYHKKRRFNRTTEPKGKVERRKAKALRFVVQKHDATRLHYDFRLELEGVLKSWAVPKGPSYDPKEKRLAVEVEDHPLDYAGFEGTIPAGEYGAGTVAVWDEGTWQPEGDAIEGYRQGKLKFHLEGKKLRGGWTLVRMHGRPGDRATNWLLIKERDENARSLDEYDVTEAEPASVTTGRTLDEIARDDDRVWQSNRAARRSARGASGLRSPLAPQAEVGHSQRRASGGGKPNRAARRSARGASGLRSPLAPQAEVGHSQRRASGGGKPNRAARRSARGASGQRRAMPGTVELQLATLVKEPPSGEQWFHEIKFDGYRILCRIDRGRVKLMTRGDQDWTARMPAIAAAAKQLPADRAILDGEVVALEPNGVSSFQRLQTAFRDKRAGELIYYVFDLLYLDGHDLRRMPLEQRKAILADLLGHSTSTGSIRYAEHVDAQGGKFFQEACRMGLEGIISKRRDRSYIGGRGYDWTKTKCMRREEFVIGGYTDPEGSRLGLGALLVGYYKGKNRLAYAGKVGTGFSEKLLAELRKRLDELRQNGSPFADFATRLRPRKAHWVKPELVAQVEFSNWTDDGRLRHPSFQCLREDKPATSVTREEPKEVTQVPRGPDGKAAGLTLQACVRDAENLTVAGVRLTHPDRLLYPEQGLTKLGLAAFYSQIADWILPHVVDRPLSLLRCPEGRRKSCFFQKHLHASASASLRRTAIQEKNKVGEYAVVDDLSGIVALVQMGVLEIHVWGSRADDVERPDRLVFDLDPAPGIEWPRVVDAAHDVRKALHSIDLESFVKTSGGKGLHVVVPMVRRHAWPEIKAFSKAVARRIAEAAPDLYTTNALKAQRKGRIFIDYLRNDRGATSIAPYSTRAREHAPVAVPVDWKELKRDLRADHFNVENLPARLARLKRDPWEQLLKLRQSITAATMKALGIRV
ncbi:MAG TPA: DNA ligase D [Pirellulales bacterium]|nr:DNA ligase D [Pirellulales bacterium]